MFPLSRRVVPLLLFAAIATAVFTVAYLRLWPFLADDAFISARYAVNLTEGHGLVFNPGERVEGYTNFLWTLLLALPIGLHLGLVPFLKGLSALCALGTAITTWRLTREVLREGESGEIGVLEVLPAALFLSTPAVILSAAEGLETMLFAFLLTLAVAQFLIEGSRPGGWPRSALAFAALGMTRPDGAPFGAFFVLLALAQRRAFAWTLRFAATFALVFGTYFALRAGYYGHWFPNTFYAKSGGDPVLIQRGWDELLRFASRCGGWLWIAAIPAFFSRRLRFPSMVLAAVVLLRVSFQLWSGGPWMGRMRFLVPVLPFLLALSAAGMSVLLRSERARWIGSVLAAAIVLTPGWLAHAQEETLAVNYGVRLQLAHGALGQRIADHTSPDALVALDDAGLTPLIANRRTIDMLGLNDAHIAHLKGRFGEKSDVGYVLARHPDLIVLLSFVDRPTRPEDFRLAGHAAMFREPQFQREFVFAREYPFGANYYLLVYRRRDSKAVPEDF